MPLDIGRDTHLQDKMHRAEASNGTAIASNWIVSTDGSKAVTWRPESASAVSYGSNSNDVSSASAVGASSLVTRADHVHRGVRTVTSNGSNGLFGDIGLSAGTGIALGVSGQTITITNTGVSGSAGGGGGSLTVEEVDGSPTDSAVTKIVVPNGSLAIASHVATITFPAGSTRAFGLDRASFDATYGDDFTGASLDAKWTRHNQTSGEETYQQGGLASILRVAHGTTNAAEYIYQTAPNGTNETWEASCTWWQEGNTQMFALLMVSSTGTGVAALVYDNSPGVYLANVASHVYSSALAQANSFESEHRSGQRVWLRLRKATGLYAASFSYDGQVYSREVTGTPTAFTPARVGIGRILGTSANDIANWHWFDKTA